MDRHESGQCQGPIFRGYRAHELRSLRDMCKAKEAVFERAMSYAKDVLRQGMPRAAVEVVLRAQG